MIDSVASGVHNRMLADIEWLISHGVHIDIGISKVDESTFAFHTIRGSVHFLAKSLDRKTVYKHIDGESVAGVIGEARAWAENAMRDMPSTVHGFYVYKDGSTWKCYSDYCGEVIDSSECRSCIVHRAEEGAGLTGGFVEYLRPTWL